VNNRTEQAHTEIIEELRQMAALLGPSQGRIRTNRLLKAVAVSEHLDMPFGFILSTF
jgi:hypothetical protein